MGSLPTPFFIILAIATKTGNPRPQPQATGAHAAAWRNEEAPYRGLFFACKHDSRLGEVVAVAVDVQAKR